jgi:hypothetical protein
MSAPALVERPPSQTLVVVGWTQIVLVAWVTLLRLLFFEIPGTIAHGVDVVGVGGWLTWVTLGVTAGLDLMRRRPWAREWIVWAGAASVASAIVCAGQAFLAPLRLGWSWQSVFVAFLLTPYVVQAILGLAASVAAVRSEVPPAPAGTRRLAALVATLFVALAVVTMPRAEKVAPPTPCDAQLSARPSHAAASAPARPSAPRVGRARRR